MRTVCASVLVGAGAIGACLLVAGAAQPGRDPDPAAELARLREEYHSFRLYSARQVQRLSAEQERFNLPTGEQMRLLYAAAARYAGANQDRLPRRSSDLRFALGQENWSMLLAYYDATPARLEELSRMDDPWKWLDEHGSFEWRGGEHDFNSHRIILAERRSGMGETRWVLFADGHVEHVTGGGFFSIRLRDAGVEISGRGEQ